MVLKAVVTWVLMIPVAILNGLFREKVVVPRIGDLRAHQVSVITGSTGFVALVYALWHGDLLKIDDEELLRMGGLWVVATIIFEFGFGHYLRGFSWEALLHDYNIRAGRLWVVVLCVVLVSPLIAKRIAARLGSMGRG